MTTINHSFCSIPITEVEQRNPQFKQRNRIEQVAQIIKGLVCEIFAMIALCALYFFSQVPFDPKAHEIEKDKKGIAIERPVLLVHGYLHNSSGWLPYRNVMKNLGKKNIFTIDLGAIPTKSIAEYADVLGKRIQQIQQITGRSDVDLVGHSMGGDVSSFYAVNRAEEDRIKIPHVLTLNSPLQGTKIARLGIGPCARDMQYKSSTMNELSKKIKECTTTRFLHVASRADAVIFPLTSSLNGEEKVHPSTIITDHGHCSILFSSTIAQRTVSFLHV